VRERQAEQVLVEMARLFGVPAAVCKMMQSADRHEVVAKLVALFGVHVGLPPVQATGHPI
jgi:hypothetical protein